MSWAPQINVEFAPLGVSCLHVADMMKFTRTMSPHNPYITGGTSYQVLSIERQHKLQMQCA